MVKNGQPKHRLIIKLVLSIIAVVVIMVITALILSMFAPERTNKDTGVSVKSTATADQIVQEFKENSTDNRTATYTEQTSSPRFSSITYKQASSDYAISLNALHKITFARIDTAVSDNDQTVIDDARTFLTDRGFEPLSTGSVNGAAIETYTNTLNVCQLAMYASSTPLPAAFELGCTPRLDATTQYSEIEALLSMYKSSGQVISADRILRSVVTGENVEIVVLAISTKESELYDLRLYFFANETATTYLGSQTLAADKQSITRSDDLQLAQESLTYGTFLTETLEKY